MNKKMITINIEVQAPIEMIWKVWNDPKDIQRWNSIDEEWHTPVVQNDCRPGGEFLYRMGTIDGRFSFDFTGKYDEVVDHEFISYTLHSGRTASITFTQGSPVIITETFEPDNEPSLKEQRDFCQAILQSFKSYVEYKLANPYF